MDAVVASRPSRGNVVCDLDGVVYLDRQPLAGAGKALRRIDAMGFHLLFVTNNSTGSPETLAGRVAAAGFPAGPDQVVGSSQAAALLLEGDRPRTLVVGGEGVRNALEEALVPMTDDWRRTEAVVVGLDFDLSYQRLRAASLAVRAGARFVATNADPTLPAPGGLWPGAGAIVAAIETAAGRAPEVAGKPHPPMRRLVASRLGPGPTWMVGDRASTDIAMARAEGWWGILVMTGAGERPDELPAAQAPHLVLPSLREVPEALEAAVFEGNSAPPFDARGAPP